MLTSVDKLSTVVLRVDEPSMTQGLKQWDTNPPRVSDCHGFDPFRVLTYEFDSSPLKFHVTYTKSLQPQMATQS